MAPNISLNAGSLLASALEGIAYGGHYKGLIRPIPTKLKSSH
jgi:hypothetical protein